MSSKCARPSKDRKLILIAAEVDSAAPRTTAPVANADSMGSSISRRILRYWSGCYKSDPSVMAWSIKLRVPNRTGGWSSTNRMRRGTGGSCSRLTKRRVDPEHGVALQAVSSRIA